MNDFDCLNSKDIYLDSACQSLRPKATHNALIEYYLTFNSCGGRVKYPWGLKTDKLMVETRQKVLDLLKLSRKDYFVAFTLNTTYGLNLLINSFSHDFKQVITSDIEHNSPFLATMKYAERNGIQRIVLNRNEDGSLPLDTDFSNALVVVNSASNIDGRTLKNLKELTKKVHKSKGIIVVDAAQAMAHSRDILVKSDADAICFSAHKMYGPSLGVMVVKRSLIKYIDPIFIGGGMVDDATKDNYMLSSEKPDLAHTIFESGLQAFGEIVAFGATIDWLNKVPRSAHSELDGMSKELYDFLKTSPKVHMVNREPNSTMSFFVEGIDSHMLGQALADEGIMARTGYFCAHYYLDHKLGLPPLVRFSLSLATRPSDIARVKAILAPVLP